MDLVKNDFVSGAYLTLGKRRSRGNRGEFFHLRGITPFAFRYSANLYVCHQHLVLAIQCCHNNANTLNACNF